jgi:hypothetical protein
MQFTHVIAAAAGIALVAGAGQDTVASLKQALQQGQTLIRQYEWVETTTISLKGEEKARKQNRCYYGADGKVQKTPVGEAAPPKAAPSGGRRGGRVKEKVVENKKDEMQDYMKSAVALIQKYVPPQAPQIQAAKDAGHVATKPQAGGSVQLEITDYLQAGDKLTIDVDPSGSRLLGLAVHTYLEKPDEQISLDVKMGSLPDGAIYAAQTTLDAPAKKIRVVVQNSGHKPVAR